MEQPCLSSPGWELTVWVAVLQKCLGILVNNWLDKNYQCDIAPMRVNSTWGWFSKEVTSRLQEEFFLSVWYLEGHIKRKAMWWNESSRGTPQVLLSGAGALTMQCDWGSMACSSWGRKRSLLSSSTLAHGFAQDFLLFELCGKRTIFTYYRKENDDQIQGKENHCDRGEGLIQGFWDLHPHRYWKYVRKSPWEKAFLSSHHFDYGIGSGDFQMSMLL